MIQSQALDLSFLGSMGAILYMLRPSFAFNPGVRGDRIARPSERTKYAVKARYSLPRHLLPGIGKFPLTVGILRLSILAGPPNSTVSWLINPMNTVYLCFRAFFPRASSTNLTSRKGFRSALVLFTVSSLLSLTDCSRVRHTTGYAINQSSQAFLEFGNPRVWQDVSAQGPCILPIYPNFEKQSPTTMLYIQSHSDQEISLRPADVTIHVYGNALLAMMGLGGETYAPHEFPDSGPDQERKYRSNRIIKLQRSSKVYLYYDLPMHQATNFETAEFFIQLDGKRERIPSVTFEHKSKYHYEFLRVPAVVGP